MSLDRASLDLLAEAVEHLNSGFESLPDMSAGSDLIALRPVLLEAAERMRDNYPYQHPLYAGQMLKPPHPVARLAYAMAQFINPNNHAMDGGRASSVMEREAVAELAGMIGWETHLGHLCGGGTMANMEALWVSGRVNPGKRVVASDQAHYTHGRISEVLQIPFSRVASDAAGRMDIIALKRKTEPTSISKVISNSDVKNYQKHSQPQKIRAVPVELIECIPKLNTLNINSKKAISIFFNQMIDPKTAKGAFKVYPEVDFLVSVIGNKVKISPENKWPDGFFKIVSSKSISDYYGNTLSAPIDLSYSTKDYIPIGEISGKIINFDDRNFYTIGLFVEDSLKNNLKLISNIEPNNNGEFFFKNIIEDEYVLVSIENNQINDIYDDIRNFNYCVKISNKMNAAKKSFNNSLYLNKPASKLDIKDLIFYNNYFGDIILSDGSTKNFIINNNMYKSSLYNDDIIKINTPNNIDSIDIVLRLENNVEDYFTKKTFLNKLNIVDSLNPRVKKITIDDDSLHVIFSEPIQIDSVIYNYNFISPIEVKFYNNFDVDPSFKKNTIFDLSGNSMLDTIIINNNNIDDFDKSGNIFGELVYTGKRDLIVELKNFTESYKTVSINNKFIFNNIKPGIYSLWAYENINKKNDNYFNGKLEPLHSSALLGIYKDEIEVRSKWDIEGIIIKID